MKSTDVYRQLHSMLSPWCKANSFKRTTGGLLGYCKPLTASYFVFWFQCSQDGWDPYAGSKFIVEFQIGQQLAIGSGSRRHRLPFFLTSQELEYARQLQNSIIAKLPRPPANYFLLQQEQHLATWYLAKFKPHTAPYNNHDDIWLRFYEPNDIQKWGGFLIELLPRIIDTWSQSQKQETL